MYLYRFDKLKALRSQRRNDPVLRAKRSDGNEEFFSHHQIKTAHSLTRENEAVYQLSFWKSFESLRANLWSHENGWVIQRIPENHIGLQGFDRGDDEYLVKHAWLYWGTMPISSENLKRASVGIPHEDIDVLHPSGEWKKMEEIPALSDCVESDWSTIGQHTPGGQRPIHWAQRGLPSGEQAVLLRQIYGSGPCLFNRYWQQQEILEFLINEGYVAGDPLPLRWFFALEQDEDIVIEELTPFISEIKTSGIRGTINRWRGITSPTKWKVGLSNHGRYLSSNEVEKLYVDFGIEEALRRGNRWSYSHLQMTPEERQSFFDE